MDKRDELAKLEVRMASEELPLRGSNLVFGEGDPDCKVMFIGEGPGANEDRLRRPFVGRAGQLLDGLIKEIGWRREDTYITNIVKRRPPDNRDPLPDEIAAYAPYLTKQIEIIDPPVIVPLGRFAMNYFMPEAKITHAHGRAFVVGGRVVFPVYHPAAALRSTEMLNTLRGDFQKLPKVVGGGFPEEMPPLRNGGSDKKLASGAAAIVPAKKNKLARARHPGLF